MSKEFSQALLGKLKEEVNKDKIEKVVVGAVIRRDSDILLLERKASDEFGGLHELPSGTVEAGEPLDKALAREVLEETALSVKSFGPYLGSFDYLSGSGKRTRQYNFDAEVDEGEVHIEPLEHESHCWVNPGSDVFQSLNVSDEVRQVITTSVDLTSKREEN